MIFHLLNSVRVTICLSLSLVDDFLEDEIIYELHVQGKIHCLVISMSRSIDYLPAAAAAAALPAAAADEAAPPLAAAAAAALPP